MRPEPKRATEAQRYSRWFTEWPSTHVSAGRTVEVMPVAEHEAAWDAVKLLPAENMALTVARAQVARGENPPINTTTVLMMALDRLRAALGEE